MKLIALDLDGTLLRSDHTVSERTVDTLRCCTAAGITVLLATARPLRSVRPVARQLGHTGLAACSNGAVVNDFHTDTIIDVHPLDVAVVNAVTADIRHTVPDVTFAVERATSGFAQDPHYPTHVGDTAWGANLPIAPIGELITDDVIKLLVETRSMSTEQLLAATRHCTAGRVEVTHSGDHGLLEISATGVTKASTLAGVATQQGLGPDDVVAFGDMPNDIPMLTWAGTSYAVANAHPDVLAAADHAVPSNDEDGVAATITELRRHYRA